MRFVYKSRGKWDMKERGENQELMQKESRVIFVWKRREHENNMDRTMVIARVWREG